MATVEKLAQEPLAQTPRYSLRSCTLVGRSVFLARTGYTGEDGFELFVSTEDLETVWRKLLEVGHPLGLQPAGLGARDTLRLEAGLPLGGADLDEATTPLEARLEWTVAWEKGPFIGREVLERQRREGVSRRLVGFRLKDPGIPRPGCLIFREDRQVGRVTSGTFLPAGASGPQSPAQAIGMGYMPPDAENPGTTLAVEIHGRRVPAEVVQLPFYRRKK